VRGDDAARQVQLAAVRSADTGATHASAHASTHANAHASASTHTGSSTHACPYAQANTCAHTSRPDPAWLLCTCSRNQSARVRRRVGGKVLGDNAE